MLYIYIYIYIEREREICWLRPCRGPPWMLGRAAAETRIWWSGGWIWWSGGKLSTEFATIYIDFQGKLSQISEVKLSHTPGGYYPVSPMSSRPVSVIRSARRFPRRLRAVMTVCSPLSSHTGTPWELGAPKYLRLRTSGLKILRT